MAAASDPPGLRALHKTLDILETIKTSEYGLKLADLARRSPVRMVAFWRR